MKSITKGMSTTGTGAVITTLGAVLFKATSMFGLGLMGLGLFHIASGLLGKNAPER